MLNSRSMKRQISKPLSFFKDDDRDSNRDYSKTNSILGRKAAAIILRQFPRSLGREHASFDGDESTNASPARKSFDERIMDRSNSMQSEMTIHCILQTDDLHLKRTSTSSSSPTLRESTLSYSPSRERDSVETYKDNAHLFDRRSIYSTANTSNSQHSVCESYSGSPGGVDTSYKLHANLLRPDERRLPLSKRSKADKILGIGQDSQISKHRKSPTSPEDRKLHSSRWRTPGASSKARSILGISDPLFATIQDAADDFSASVFPPSPAYSPTHLSYPEDNDTPYSPPTTTSSSSSSSTRETLINPKPPPLPSIPTLSPFHIHTPSPLSGSIDEPRRFLRLDSTGSLVPLSLPPSPPAPPSQTWTGTVYAHGPIQLRPPAAFLRKENVASMAECARGGEEAEVEDGVVAWAGEMGIVVCGEEDGGEGVTDGELIEEIATLLAVDGSAMRGSLDGWAGGGMAWG